MCVCVCVRTKRSNHQYRPNVSFLPMFSLTRMVFLFLHSHTHTERARDDLDASFDPKTALTAWCEQTHLVAGFRPNADALQSQRPQMPFARLVRISDRSRGGEDPQQRQRWRVPFGCRSMTTPSLSTEVTSPQSLRAFRCKDEEIHSTVGCHRFMTFVKSTRYPPVWKHRKDTPKRNR